ncbi:MAG: HAD family hydrolase [Candidatus Methanospirareceae archaeon]
MRRYEVVIFDMDGTLLDSRGAGERPYMWAYEALKETLAFYGKSLTMDEMDESFFCSLYERREEGLKDFCNRLGIAYKDFWRLREENTIRAKIREMKRGGIKLKEGAEEVVKYLHFKGYDLAVVSDSQQECVDFTMHFFGLAKFFKVWYGRGSNLEELRKIKPNPYYIKKVLKELGVGAKDAIVVDDSPIGVLAAMKAGIDSIFIYGGEYEVEEDIKKGVTYLVRDIREIKGIL